MHVDAQEALVKWATLEDGQAKVFGIRRPAKSMLNFLRH